MARRATATRRATVRRRATLIFIILIIVAVPSIIFGVPSCRGRSRDDYLASGKKYYDAGQYHEAVVEFLNAVQMDPRFGESRMRLAEAYMMTQDLQNGGQEYVNAASLLVDNVEAQLKAASMLLLAHQYQDARECAERALEVEPKNVSAQILHANALAGLKKFEAARAAIQGAIALDPTSSTGYADLGVLQLAGGEPDQAEASFKKAVEIDPEIPDTHVALATFYWSRARMPEAEAAFKHAADIDPRHIMANRALAAFYLGNNRAPEAERHLKAIAETVQTVGAWLTLADYYLTMNRRADAVNVLNTVAKDREGYGEARSRLAVVAYAAGDKAEAHKIIDETLANDPSHPRALLTKGDFLLAEHRTDDALSRVKAAIAVEPRSVVGHYTLGAIYGARQENEEAVREFNEVLKLNPSSVAAKMQLARLNLAQGRTSLASDFAQQTVKARPRDLAVRTLLVRTLIGKGEISNAEAELKPLLALFPDTSELHWLAGAVSLLKGQPAVARQSFARSLQLTPDAIEPVDAIVNLDIERGNAASARTLVEQQLLRRPNDPTLLLLAAKVYQALGDTGTTEQVLRQAIEKDPTFRTDYEALGQLYFSQKRLDQALAEFRGLAQQDPKSISAHTMAGMILHVQQKPAEAQKSYQRALEINPHAVIAANNLAWLYADQGGNLDVALQLAQTAKSLLPEQPDFNDTLGWVYLKKDLPSLAIPPLRIAVDKAPKDPNYQYHLGLAYAKIGDSTRARQALETVLKLDANFGSAQDVKRVLASLP